MATSARLDELKKKFDENPRRYFAPLANEYRKLGDLPQAIALCRAHLPNQPGHISGHIVLAQALYEARELGESRQIFEASLDLDPENLIALRFLGDIAREQGEPDQARVWYERVLEADPRNDEIAQLLRTVEFAAPSEPATARTTPFEGIPALLAESPSDQIVAPPAFADSSFSVETTEAPPAPRVPASPIATIHDAFPEPVEILGDLPGFTPPVPEPGVAHATTGDSALTPAGTASIPDDLFADELPAQAMGELEAVAEPIPEDWFAPPAAQAAPWLPMETATAGTTEDVTVPAFDDSLFPDLSEMTPSASPAVPLEMDEVSLPAISASEAPTPPYVPAARDALTSTPTPPFLAAVSSQSESPEWPSVSDDALGEPDVAAEGTETPVVGAAEAETPEEEVAGTWMPEPSVAGEWEADSEPAAAPLMEVDVVSQSDDASVVEPTGPTAGIESMETILGFPEGATDAEPFEGFVVEYGEFVPPVEDDTPFIASSISVPLDEPDARAAGVPDAYAAGAPELSAHEPFSIDSTFGEPEPVPTSSAAAAEDEGAEPIEGLVSRDVDEFSEVSAGVEETFTASVQEGAPEVEGAPFVTETMAELYLQQGFHDEALAIYRQLLAQQPDDPSLQDRVSALERGAASAVEGGIAPRDAADRHGQSVRSFFAHFARREPRQRREISRRDDESEAGPGVSPDAPRSSGAPDVAFAGVATREEAMTVPDEGMTPRSLNQLFAAGVVSHADEHAATTLASAFEARGDSPLPPRSGERELSLEHLFRDVPARSSGAVTLDEFYQGSSPGGSDPSAQGTEDGEERDADIEQFTAWLEGLKKK